MENVKHESIVLNLNAIVSHVCCSTNYGKNGAFYTKG